MLEGRTMNRKIHNLLVLSLVLLWAFPLHAADEETLFNELKDHKARAASTWSALVEKDIRDRILPAPDIILDYIRKDNELQGYTERPRKPVLDPAFAADIVDAYAELPGIVKGHINDHVVAVFLVEELGGTAYAELLRDFETNTWGFIVMDVGSLDKRANEWISWRENSPFATKGTYRIEAEIEEEGRDARKAAIQYILLHEVGHIVGVAKGAHPNWFVGGPPEQWPFTRLSWLTFVGGLQGTSRFDDTFTERSNVKYYTFEDAPLTSGEIYEVYDHLLKTDFVSLYAATNMYDDFAETYAMYVHVVLQQRPWKVTIMKGGDKALEIRDTILAARCEAKKAYLDSMFQ